MLNYSIWLSHQQSHDSEKIGKSFHDESGSQIAVYSVKWILRHRFKTLSQLCWSAKSQCLEFVHARCTWRNGHSNVNCKEETPTPSTDQLMVTSKSESAFIPLCLVFFNCNSSFLRRGDCGMFFTSAVSTWAWLKYRRGLGVGCILTLYAASRGTHFVYED